MKPGALREHVARPPGGGVRDRLTRVKMSALRNWVQLTLVLLLNFTAIGGLVISPYLPILRLTSIVHLFVPIMDSGESQLCALATAGRCITGTWSPALLLPLLAGVTLVGMLLGRALCGWACPFGLIQDWLYKLRARWFAPKRMPAAWHERLLGLKYGLLIFLTLVGAGIGLSALADHYAGTLFAAYWPELFQASPYCALCFPISINTLMGVARGTIPSVFGPYTLLQFLVLLLLCVGAYLVPLFWCRYFCWVGAVGSLFNGASLLSLRKDQTTCTQCGACARACPTQNERPLTESTLERVSDRNCVFCLECVESCPSQSLALCVGDKPLYRGGREWWS